MTTNQFPQYKFGKLPAVKGSITFRYKRYVDSTLAPRVPEAFGYPESEVSHWGLFYNDRCNTGVFAAFAHEETLRGRRVNRPVEFTDYAILADYMAASGFDFTPASDLGISLAHAAAFRRRTGISDYKNDLHQVAGYAALKPRNVDELIQATYLFGSVIVGLEISTRALAQFAKGEVWDVSRRGKVVGTTAAAIVGRRDNGNLVAVIWGRLQELTPEFYRKYNDESVVFFTKDQVDGTSAVPGFKAHLLAKDLRKLASAGDEGVAAAA